MKPLKKMSRLTVAALVGACALATTLFAHEATYVANMTGDQVINPDFTMGSGSTATGFLRLQSDEITQVFDVLELTVHGISPSDLDQSHGPNNTAIHIRFDTSGQGGGPADDPIVIDLGWYIGAGFGALTATADGFQVTISGEVLEIQGAYMMTNDTGMTPADVLTAVEDGLTYIQIHTVAHPDGDIRGPLEPETVPTENATWGVVKQKFSAK